jgi:hypothetical protein
VKFYCLFVFLPLVSQASSNPGADHQPDAVVRKLYHEVVARQPLGIPAGTDKAVIWPLLSKGLIRRLEAARACQADYVRQHKGDDGKPEYGWLESGLFSGENEEALPADAVVERTDPQQDGSFRAYVRLTYGESFKTHGRSPDPANTFSWSVAASVISEGGKFVIDDVLLFKGDSTDIKSRLSDSFPGCEGSRWIGLGSIGHR